MTLRVLIKSFLVIYISSVLPCCREVLLQCKFTKEWLKSVCEPHESLLVSLVPGNSLVSSKILLMNYKLALGYG